MSDLSINISRLLSRLAALGARGELPEARGKGVKRLALTPQDKEGRDLVTGWMRELGLRVSIDAIGNVVAVLPGENPGPAVMMGSHIDTVATGGRYDGCLGVLAALEVLETVKESGLKLKKNLACAFFTNEEGARFAPDMMGSLVYVGDLALDQALATTGIDGSRVGDDLAAIGYAGDAPVGRPDACAYLELHVEQGPVLEAAGADIGVVEAVQGIYWNELTFEGTSNHAGCTPMALRKDPGQAAFETACAVRRAADEAGGAQLGTVGRMVLHPNLVNVIAAKAAMTVDLRNTDAEGLRRTFEQVMDAAGEYAKRHGCTLTRRVLADFAPQPFDPALVSLVESTARELGQKTMRLPSGAGHDAQILARVCPAAMIFVPSVGGFSHNVEEFTRPEHVEAGANVLLRMALRLAGA